MNYTDNEILDIINSAKRIKSVSNNNKFCEHVSKDELIKSLRLSYESLNDNSLQSSAKREISKHINSIERTLKRQGHKDLIFYDFNPKNA